MDPREREIRGLESARYLFPPVRAAPSPSHVCALRFTFMIDAVLVTKRDTFFRLLPNLFRFRA